jgi:hypothetical protein
MSMPAPSKVARVILIGALGSWALLITLNQDPRRKFQPIQRLDPAGAYLPDWRFFAPNPGVNDYHLLSRDKLDSGDMTPWKEVSNAEQRRLAHILFHSNRRCEKALFDAVTGIIHWRPPEGGSQEDIQLSIAYLTLLNYITHRVAHHEQVKETQFLIAKSDGYDEIIDPAPMFLSNFHPIG